MILTGQIYALSHLPQKGSPSETLQTAVQITIESQLFYTEKSLELFTN